METPLVSVVVPTYARPEKLRRAVETVRAQTYRPIELVVVDDHSPEPAADALEEITLDDVSLTLVRHDQNRGGNAARNTGIRESTGEFVAFLDDDDRWEPAKIQRQIETFQSSPDSVGLVYTGARYIYDDGERVIANDIEGTVTRQILAGANVAEFSALIVRRSVIEQAGLPDERFPSWQDREWFLRLSQHCEFGAITDPLTIRHWDHTGRIGQDFEKRRDISFPLFVEKHHSLAAEYGLEERFVASLLETLVIDAAQNGYYGDARRLAFRAIRTAPTLPTPWLYLLACLGGSLTYRPAKRLMAIVQSGDGRGGDIGG